MTEAAATTDLLTIEEVSARLRVPIGTLRFWRHKGVGPAGFRLGRRVLYPVADCEAWLARQMAEQEKRDA
jgi:DNA-binding transcriptional MerR regulator